MLSPNIRTESSVCYVSYWHVPNGCDYDRAEVRKMYFDDIAEAQDRAKHYEYPPMMAMVVPLEPR